MRVCSNWALLATTRELPRYQQQQHWMKLSLLVLTVLSPIMQLNRELMVCCYTVYTTDSAYSIFSHSWAHELMTETMKMTEWMKSQLKHSMCQNVAAQSIRLYWKCCLTHYAYVSQHLCCIAQSTYRSRSLLPNSTFSYITPIRAHASLRHQLKSYATLLRPTATTLVSL